MATPSRREEGEGWPGGARSPAIPEEIAAQVDLDRANFVSNERLAQVLAGLSRLAIVPAGRLPGTLAPGALDPARATKAS